MSTAPPPPPTPLPGLLPFPGVDWRRQNSISGSTAAAQPPICPGGGPPQLRHWINHPAPTTPRPLLSCIGYSAGSDPPAPPPFHFFSPLSSHFIETQEDKALKLERNSTLRLHISQAFLGGKKAVCSTMGFHKGALISPARSDRLQRS